MKLVVSLKWACNIGGILQTGGNWGNQKETCPSVTASKTNRTLTVLEKMEDPRLQLLVTAWAISITQEKSVLTTQRTPFISVTRIQYRLGKQMILFWQWHKILEHTLWQMWRFLTLEYALLRSKSGFKMSVFRVIQCILSISSCSFSNVSPKTPFLDFPNGIHKFHISRTSLEQISKQFKLQ